MNFVKTLPIAAAALVLSTAAQAVITIDITEQGANVVLTASGSVDVTGLSAQHAGNNNPYISGANGQLSSGALGGASVSRFTGLNSQTWFTGTGTTSAPTSGSGDRIGILNSVNILLLPRNYASGTFLSNSNTWAGASLGSLGLIAGSYTYSWSNDSVKLNITAAVPEPQTTALMLAGLCLVAGVARRRSPR